MEDKKYTERITENLNVSNNGEEQGAFSDDILVGKFFEDNRIAVADDGFSRRVMHRLPSRVRIYNVVWTALCLIAGILLFLKYKGWTVIEDIMKKAVSDVMAHDTIMQHSWILAVCAFAAIVVCSYNMVAGER